MIEAVLPGPNGGGLPPRKIRVLVKHILGQDFSRNKIRFALVHLVEEGRAVYTGEDMCRMYRKAGP